MLVKLQLVKAQFPIEVTLLGISMLVKLQLVKAEFPIEVTLKVLPSMVTDEGILTATGVVGSVSQTTLHSAGSNFVTVNLRE